MSIVFGWYGITIKSYSAIDLGLTHQDWANSVFDVRQNVFHLFWIPFFPIGKDYTVRQRGKRYDLSDEMISIMKEKRKVRTPWYAFTLPLLGISVLLFIWLLTYIEKQHYYSREKQLYESQIPVLESDITNLTNNRCIALEHQDDKEYSNLYLRVIGVNGSEYKAQVMHHNLGHGNPTPHYFTQFMYRSDLESDTITFSKDDLQEAICKKFSRYYKRKPCGFDFLGDGKKYSIKKLVTLDEPVIGNDIGYRIWSYKTMNYKESFKTDYSNKSYNRYIELQNIGNPADLIEIKNIEGNMVWTDSLPLHFKPNEYSRSTRLNIGKRTDKTGSANFKSVLVFQDSLKRKFEYLIEGDFDGYQVRKNQAASVSNN